VRRAPRISTRRAALFATLVGVAAATGCKDATGPTTGAAHVTVTTTGIDLDADGYTVTVDGKPQRTVAARDAITFPRLPTGTHTVELIGLTVNCVVSGDNPRTVTVARGTTTQVTFSVTCVADVGTLRVTAATTGLDLDADGYTVSVDDGASRQVGVNGELTVSEVRSGDHVVRLNGSASNCTVTESNLKTVAVAFGATAEVTFTVTCIALTGDLRVTTATTGVELDAGGYLVTVDGGPSQVVGVIGAATITGLRAGDHAVALDDVASNCTVDGANPRTVTVRPDATVEILFAVTCVATTGSLQVTVTTTGADPDPNGYVVVLDSCTSYSCDRENGGYELIRTALGANDTALVARLAPRDYSVALDDVAANCAARPSPENVTITAGSTTLAAFTIACSPTTGSIRVTTATTGADLDPNGYAARVDGGPWQALPLSGLVVFSDLPAGDHTVVLDGVAANCVIAGDNPHTVSVAGGAATEVAFAVTCSTSPGGTGSLRVTIATTGDALDPDGYRVDVSALGFREGVPVNGSVVYAGLTPGERSVALSGVAANCGLSGTNPQTVTVTSEAVAEVAFALACSSALTGSVQITTATAGTDLDHWYRVIVVGSGFQVFRDVGVNGSVTFSGVPAGEHSVHLTDIASNCAVIGANPQTVTVTAGAASDGAFTVTCGSGAPTLRVRIATTGGDLDPNGYRVNVLGLGFQDGTTVNGSVGFYFVPPGEYPVQLSDIAANCAVVGANPQTAVVTEGATAEVAFAVTCSSSNNGSVRVTTVTTGDDLDPNGYLVELRGGGYTLPATGAFTYTSIPPGEYSIELSDVASNCAVTGANPRTVTVTTGATAEVAFAVTCRSLSGSLRVTVATTGADLDPNGYTVFVQGLCHWQSDGDGGFGDVCEYERTESVGVNGAVTIPDVPVGAGMWLQDVAPNCTVGGENPRNAGVSPGGTADVAFAVTCLATGSVRVSVATTGLDLDPDGYGVLVQAAEGDVSYGLTVDGTMTIQLVPGEYRLRLFGVAPNCTVGGQNTVSLTVVAGDTHEVAFAVNCTALGGMLVIVATTGVDVDPDGYRVRVDGAWYVTYATPVNGSITISGLAAGDHTVALEGVASNCAVDGASPRTVSIAAGATAEVAFAVTCAALGSGD